MRYIKLAEWAKENGYSYRGAYNRFHAGNLKGARYYGNRRGKKVTEEILEKL